MANPTALTPPEAPCWLARAKKPAHKGVAQLVPTTV